MKEKAVKKINAEMEGESAYIKYIGEYLLNEIEVRDIAEYILDDEKNIRDLMKTMTKVAEKKLSNGKKVAVMTDEEIKKIVEEYFGISNIKRLEVVKGKVINLSLDDLLGVE